VRQRTAAAAAAAAPASSAATRPLPAAAASTISGAVEAGPFGSLQPWLRAPLLLRPVCQPPPLHKQAVMAARCNA
jgi:hypothetical protein